MTETEKVGNAIERQLEKAFEAFKVGFEPLRIEDTVAEVQYVVKTINQKMWDKLTKKEIVDLLIDDEDQFTLDALTAHPTCVSALKETQEVHREFCDAVVQDRISYYNCVNIITREIEDIKDLYMIFGLNDLIKDRVVTFNEFMSNTLSAETTESNNPLDLDVLDFLDELNNLVD